MQGESEPDVEERQVAVGGGFDRRAGCLFVPFIPVRAAGALIVTTKRVIFDPILYYKLFVRKMAVGLDEIERAESSGRDVALSVTELVTFGRTLTLYLKGGKSRSYRSMQADELAEVINRTIADAGRD